MISSENGGFSSSVSMSLESSELKYRTILKINVYNVETDYQPLSAVSFMYMYYCMRGQ